MRGKLRVLVLMREEKVPPESLEEYSEKEIMDWKTEYSVVTALKELGHDIHQLGVYDDLSLIRDTVLQWRPQIVFNLLEDFSGLGTYVPFLLGYFELLRLHYTGCNPRGLILTENKALMRKILKHHRIPMPDFFAVPRGKKPKRPARLGFPLFVKSSTEHGSVGISRASLVTSDEKLAERVAYVHEKTESDAIVEEYIEGREIYQAVMGHNRLEALPVWELFFEKLADGAPRIATAKAKWDPEYQKRAGIMSGPAEDLPSELTARVSRLCKRVYKILDLSAYARIDMRLTPQGKIYVLEPNPNPDIARDQEFPEAALAAGYEYNDLIQKILTLGMTYRAGWKE